MSEEEENGLLDEVRALLNSISSQGMSMSPRGSVGPEYVGVRVSVYQVDELKNQRNLDVTDDSPKFVWENFNGARVLAIFDKSAGQFVEEAPGGSSGSGAAGGGAAGGGAPMAGAASPPSSDDAGARDASRCAHPPARS